MHCCVTHSRRTPPEHRYYLQIKYQTFKSNTMDSKRSNTKTSQSSSSCDSSGSSPGGSPSSPAPCKAPAGNAFANDGSFMEMFKKKMEEEKRKRELEQERSEKRSAEEGQSTQEKKTFNVTSFVRGLAVITQRLKQASKLATSIFI